MREELRKWMSRRGSQRIRESLCTTGSTGTVRQIRAFGKIQEAKWIQLSKWGSEGRVSGEVYGKLWPLCNSCLCGATAKPLVVGLRQLLANSRKCELYVEQERVGEARISRAPLFLSITISDRKPAKGVECCLPSALQFSHKFLFWQSLIWNQTRRGF